MTAKTYAHAIAKLASDPSAREADLVANLVAHLKRTGRLKLMPLIAAELRRLSLRRTALVPTLEIAAEGERGRAEAQVRAAGMDVSRVVVNSDLIRGWRARSGGLLVDHSAKRALIDLYRTITR